MRALFLSTQVPVPVDSGYAIRTLSLVRALAELGHEVDFLSFTNRPVTDLRPLSDLCREVALLPQQRVNLTRGGDYLGRLTALLRGRPFAIQRCASPKMLALTRQFLADNRYDFVLGDGVYGLANLPDTPVPVVLNCHNVEWMIIKRYAALEKHPLKRAYARIEAARMRRAEQAAGRRSAVATVCSAVDGATLRQMCPDLPVVVVPNTIDIASFCSSAAETISSPPTVLFQGVMDWYPNRDAVEFFVAQIWPAVRARLPQARFLIAGRNPPADWRQRWSATDGIEVTGTVPDLAPYVRAATVVAVPLRIGSGTRIKILEAAAARRPVVSTSVGAEGLEFQPGKEILIADAPDEFAAAVIELLANSERRAQMAQAAYAVVCEHYSQASVTAAMRQALSHVRSVAAQTSAVVEELPR